MTRDRRLPPRRLEGSEARLAIKDPLISDRVSLAGRNYPLAADLSIGTAALLAENQPQRLGFIRMIRPAKYAFTARLLHLQPYDRNKIPVLMIHGLQDTPATWAPLLNELRSDPQINRRYQFWVYNYPSGPLHDGRCWRVSSDPTSLGGIIPVDVLPRKYKKE